MKNDILKSIGFGLLLFAILLLCVLCTYPQKQLNVPEGVNGFVLIGYTDLGKGLSFTKEVNKRIPVPCIAYPDTVAPLLIDKKKFEEATKLLRDNKITAIDPKEKVK